MIVVIFGIISFISVTPLIAIQALGIMYNIRLKHAEKEAAEETFEELEGLEGFVVQTDEQDEQNTNNSEDNSNE